MVKHYVSSLKKTGLSLCITKGSDSYLLKGLNFSLVSVLKVSRVLIFNLKTDNLKNHITLVHEIFNVREDIRFINPKILELALNNMKQLKSLVESYILSFQIM